MRYGSTTLKSTENRAQLLHRLLGVEVSKAIICRAIRRLGYTRKNQWVRVREEFFSAAWRVMVVEQIDVERLVFVDEMGSGLDPGRRTNQS